MGSKRYFNIFFFAFPSGEIDRTLGQVQDDGQKWVRFEIFVSWLSDLVVVVDSGQVLIVESCLKSFIYRSGRGRFLQPKGGEFVVKAELSTG